MKKIFRYTLLLWLSLLSACQGSEHKDSPEQLRRADSLLAHYPDSAYYLLKDMHISAEQEPYTHAAWYLLRSWAAYRTYRQDIDSALLQSSIDYFQHTDAHRWKALGHYLQAVTAEERGNSNTAELARHFMLGCKEVSKTGQHFLAAQLYHRNGILLSASNQYNEAIDHLVRYAYEAKLSGSHKDEVIALINLSYAYLSRDRRQKAFAVPTGYALRAVELARRYGLTVEQGKALGQLSTCYSHAGQFEKALQSATMAKDLDEKLFRSGMRKQEVKYTYIADAHRKLNHADSAIHYAHLGISHPSLEVRVNSHHLLYIVYRDLLKDSVAALNEMIAMRQLEDSLQSHRQIVKVAQQEIITKVDELDKERQTVMKQRNGIILSGILLILAILGSMSLILAIYRKKMRHNERILIRREKLLHHQHEQLNAHTTRLAEQEELHRKLAQRIVETDTFIAALQQEPHFLSDDDWHRIRKTVDMAFTNYSHRLQSDFPHLTPLDIQLCLLIKLRFPVAQISIMIATSPTSVSRQKQRLKHRILLDSPNALEQTDSLDSFLQSY